MLVKAFISMAIKLELCFVRFWKKIYLTINIPYMLDEHTGET